VLESVDGRDCLQAEDVESETSGDRLALLAVVRGLEALDQPSRVTLVTNNRYVARGLRFGLREWRENQWRWERFGQMMPVRNGDLWRRIDHALRYHHVECRAVGLDWRNARAADENSVQLRTAPHNSPRRGRWRRLLQSLLDGWQGVHQWWTSGNHEPASHIAC